MEEKDNKSLVEYNENKGFFKWIKSKFNKLFTSFKGNKDEIKIDSKGKVANEEDLDKINAGYPYRNEWLEKYEVEAKNLIKNIEVKETNNIKGELTEEELDEVKAGQTIVKEDDDDLEL